MPVEPLAALFAPTGPWSWAVAAVDVALVSYLIYRVLLLIKGTNAVPMRAEFMEEVQVKSAGYAAEFGGSTGGVINAITRSGTNTFSGSIYRVRVRLRQPAQGR